MSVTPASRLGFFNVLQNVVTNFFSGALAKETKPEVKLIRGSNLKQTFLENCPTVKANQEIFPINANLLTPPVASSVKGEEANPALITIQNLETNESLPTNTVAMNVSFFIETSSFLIITLEGLIEPLKSRLGFSRTLTIIQ